MQSKGDRGGFNGRGRGGGDKGKGKSTGTNTTTAPSVSKTKGDRGMFSGRGRGRGRGKDRGTHTKVAPGFSATAPSAPIPTHPAPTHNAHFTTRSATASDAPSWTHSETATDAPTLVEASTSSENDSRVLIIPNGKEFIPYETSKRISDIIKSKYEQPWIGWHKVPTNVRKMWFREFQGLFKWDYMHDQEIQKIWRAKSVNYVRQSLGDIRRGKSAGKWMPEKVLKSLKEMWTTDPRFQRMSDQNKKNITANKDGYLNRGGAISTSERRRRYGKQLGRSVSIPEVFMKVNYNENTRKWATLKAKNTFIAYKKLKASKKAQGITNIDDSECFYEATGGCNKKGLAYGFGSEVSFYSSTSSNSGLSSVVSFQQLYDRIGILEKRNDLLESELTSIRSLLQKLTSTSHFSSGYDASSSVIPNTLHDGDDGDDDDDDDLEDGEDLGDDDGDMGWDGDEDMECDEGDS